MLRAIVECDGDATTSEIRDVTGLSNSQVAYRRSKLEEFGLIEVRAGEPTGSRTPPKVHSLTETARTHVDAGLFDLYSVPVTSDVEQLGTQFNHLRDRVDELTVAIERLEETVEAMQDDYDRRIGTAGEVREATDGRTLAYAMSTIPDEVDDLDEERREEIEDLDDRKKDRLRVFQ